MSRFIEDFYFSVWGQRHQNFLKQHKRVQFNIMVAKGTLWFYLPRLTGKLRYVFSADGMDTENEQYSRNSKKIVSNELIYS